MSEDLGFSFFVRFVCLTVLVKEHRVVQSSILAHEGLGVGTCASRDMKCLCVMQKVGRPLCKSFSIPFTNSFCWCFCFIPLSSNNTECFHSETYLTVCNEHFRKAYNQKSKQKIVVTFPSIRSRAQWS